MGKYVGPWRNDEPHGSHGFTSLPCGTFYHGEFMNGREHGEGRLTMSDRSTYVGQFENGLRAGRGKAVYRSPDFYPGASVHIEVPLSSYEGEFMKDCFHGQGIFRWPDGRNYEGQWAMNVMHGHGRFTFADARKYEGQYKHGEKSGEGSYTWPDGRLYVGQVLHGAQHGRGVYTNAKGKRREGIWHLGRPAAAQSSQIQQGQLGELEWI